VTPTPPAASRCEACLDEIGDVRVQVQPDDFARFEDALPAHHALLAQRTKEVEEWRTCFNTEASLNKGLIQDVERLTKERDEAREALRKYEDVEFGHRILLEDLMKTALNYGKAIVEDHESDGSFYNRIADQLAEARRVLGKEGSG